MCLLFLGEDEDDKEEKEEEAKLLHDQLHSTSPPEKTGDGRRESVETQSTASLHSEASLLLAEHANDVCYFILFLLIFYDWFGPMLRHVVNLLTFIITNEHRAKSDSLRCSSWVIPWCNQVLWSHQTVQKCLQEVGTPIEGFRLWLQGVNLQSKLLSSSWRSSPPNGCVKPLIGGVSPLIRGVHFQSEGCHLHIHVLMHVHTLVFHSFFKQSPVCQVKCEQVWFFFFFFFAGWVGKHASTGVLRFCDAQADELASSDSETRHVNSKRYTKMANEGTWTNMLLGKTNLFSPSEFLHL